ncbi:MAG: RNA polymerase sigma factor [Anaerolineae bacterium]
MVQADEREWLLQAKQGDTMAFARLVHRHQTAVFNVAYRMLGRRQDAEDAAQAAFLRAYRALERFDTSRPFAPWIKRITTNLCLNRIEAARARPTVLATDLGQPEEEAADMDTWPHAAPTPEQVLLAQEQGVRIRAAILQLPPHYRAVIELRHFQEMRYDEIAEVVGRPLSSVKSDLFRARKMLAKMLKRIVDI